MKNIKDQEAQQTKGTNEPKPIQKKYFLWKMIKLFVLIAIVVLIIGVWQSYNQSSKIRHKMSGSFEGFQAQLSQLQNQLQLANQTIESQGKSLERIQETFAKDLQAKSNDKNNWIVLETEYLIQMADFILQTEHNTQITIELLKTADFHLKKLNNPKSFEVRKVLANDIIALQSAHQIDVQGTYTYLQSLNDQVDQLQLLSKDINFESQSKEIKKDEKVSMPLWKKALASSVRAIGKIIIIRHREEPVEPLLSSKQFDFLKLNLHVLFAQAQFSLIREQDVIYSSTLQQIQNIIQKYFVQSNPVSQKILSGLSDLQKIDIKPKLPDISNSVNAIRQLSNFQFQKVVVKNQPADSAVGKERKQ